MQTLFDKIVLLGLCILTMSFTEIEWFTIVIMLFAILISSLCGYFENKYPIFLCVGYIVLCLFVPGLFMFLPLIVYDCSALKVDDTYFGAANSRKWMLHLCWLAVLPAVYLFDIPQIAIAVTLSCGIAFLLQHRTNTQLITHDELLELRDDTKERAEQLERKNRDLMESRDNEVMLATLAERNRIAREIHDNVGHMLTRSLLQISALRITHPEENDLTDELDMIKNTLSDAMDSIRNSVHNLHDESIDLKSRLSAMIDGFAFCPIKLRYDAGELPAEVKLCFIAIAREALSNIAKHSNASTATITLMEHPSFYQLVIADNGNAFAKKGYTDKNNRREDNRRSIRESGNNSGGIGLQNISDRVDALGGIFRIEQTKGFSVFISVPKERGDKTN
ncbi:MAG: sensor histidine kinase [Oscillospiraceae bacterium]|nr:sensor histidine kinase [Oscillospiraceae bacterium]